MVKKFALTIFAALALASCGGGGGDGPAGSGADQVPAVAPPAGKQWTEVVEQTAEGYRMGNPDAPLKLVEYGSRLCPTCQAVALEGMKTLEDKYVKTGRLSYEFREFLVHGPPDVPFAKLGLCVGPDAFFPILQQMFVSQETFTRLQSAAVQDQAFVASLNGMTPTQQATAWGEKLGAIEFMKQHGMPEAEARACLNDSKALEKMAKVTSDAGASGLVTGTPTFILNDKKLDSVITWKALEPALKAAGG